VASESAWAWRIFEICDMVIEAIVEDVGGGSRQSSANLCKVVGAGLAWSRPNTIRAADRGGSRPHGDESRPGGWACIFFNPGQPHARWFELVLGPQTNRATAEQALAFRAGSLGQGRPSSCKIGPPVFLVERACCSST